ncbi:MAG: CBS domain-containing protein [Planctomycetota bacterium]|jgi:CBS domain-containing protein
MATSQTEIRSPAVELSPEAFKVFCEGIASVFELDIQCNHQQAVAATIPDLERRFEKLVAVDCIRAEGVIEGTLQFVFDRAGLFTLAGILLGMPEAEILRNTEHGSLADGEDLSDAIREIGHLMAGAWQRLFNEKFDNPSRFVKISTFIGDPWNQADEKIDVPANEDLLLVCHEITIEPYPTFTCGVIVSETVLAGAAVSPGEETAAADLEAEDQVKAASEGDYGESAEGQIEAAPEEAEDRVEAASEEDSEESAEGQIEAVSEEVPEEDDGQVEAASEEVTDDVAGGQIEGGSEGESEEEAEGQIEPVSEEDAVESAEEQIEEKAEDVEGLEAETEEEGSEADEDAASAEPEVSAEAEDAPQEAEAGDEVAEEPAVEDDQGEEPTAVSESIQKMTQSPAVLPGQSAQLSLAMPVEQIMQKEVVWGSPDESVQQAFTKMQHHNAGYVMIGDAGVLEGIVSQSDLTGAISPYLRPMFAKWRRPSDDATLQIKIKWIMSRLVRTIGPQASVAAAMESMCRSGGGCLPVVDQQGQVLGLVTAFDIFKALSTPGFSGAGESSALRTSA